MAGLVSSVGAAHPPLGDPMATLGRLHAAHAAALDAQPSTEPSTEPSTGRRPPRTHVRERPGRAAGGAPPRAASRGPARRLVRGRPERRPGPAAGLHVGRGRPAPGRPAPDGGLVSTLDALQTTLAAEHAAVYVYGVLGGQTSRTSDPALFAAVSAAYGEHRARRDALTRFVTDLGGTPVAAEASYELPAALGTAPPCPARPWPWRSPARRRTPSSSPAPSVRADAGPSPPCGTRRSVSSASAARPHRSPGGEPGARRVRTWQRSANSSSGELPRCSPEETSTRTAGAWTTRPMGELPPEVGGLTGLPLCKSHATRVRRPRRLPFLTFLHCRNLQSSVSTRRRPRRGSPRAGAPPRPGRPRCGRPGRPGSS